MNPMPSRRAVVAFGLLAAALMGAAIASQRSAAAMETAANKFLEGLTAEQRQRAALPYDEEERTRSSLTNT